MKEEVINIEKLEAEEMKSVEGGMADMRSLATGWE